VAGPALGALAAVVGPRVPFYLAAAVAGINAVIAARRLPETHHPAKEEAAPRGVRSWNPLAALAGAQGASQLISVAFFTLLSFSAFEATFSLFGHSRLGFDVGSSAGVFAVIGLVIVVVQGGLVHPVVMHLGEMGTLRAGLLAEVAGLLGLAFVHSWGALVPALLALTVGQGLVQTTMSSALAGRAPPQRRGAVLGAQQSAGGLARVLGPILGGVLFERIGPGSPYVAGAAVVGVCLLLLQSAVASPATTPL
jgi:MFS transporter, DHA1 family, tetracycline resistance protein